MKNYETTFSVVIPCYNAESSIERCLNSIKENYYDNVEIIIVNDNSTDKTSTILQEYIANNIGLNIIYVENEKNLGAGKSRNKGIEISSCEYITFVDADDLISTSFFKELNLIIRQKNMIVLYLMRYAARHVVKKNLVCFTESIMWGV